MNFLFRSAAVRRLNAPQRSNSFRFANYCAPVALAIALIALTACQPVSIDASRGRIGNNPVGTEINCNAPGACSGFNGPSDPGVSGSSPQKPLDHCWGSSESDVLPLLAYGRERKACIEKSCRTEIQQCNRDAQCVAATFVERDCYKAESAGECLDSFRRCFRSQKDTDCAKKCLGKDQERYCIMQCLSGYGAKDRIRNCSQWC